MRLLKSNTVINKKDTAKKTAKKIQQNMEDMNNIKEKVVRGKPFDDHQFINREMKTIQEEKKELLRLVTKLQQEVIQLKERLAEKEEQISRTIKRRQMRTVAHVETLALLSSTKADLKECYQRYAALEQKLVGESEDGHQNLECLVSGQSEDHFRGRQSGQEVETFNKEVSKKEEALKLQLLEKEQQMEEQMMQRLNTMKEDFEKKLLEEREKNKQEQSEREERLRQQLEEKEDSFKKQLSLLCEHCDQSSALEPTPVGAAGETPATREPAETARGGEQAGNRAPPRGNPAVSGEQPQTCMLFSVWSLSQKT